MSRPVQQSSAFGRAVLGLVATAVAWVVVLAHLASTLHFALVSHDICAVHGDLVHRATATLGHAAHHATGAAALPGSTEADDEHCPLLGRPHDQLGLVTSPRLEVAPPALAPQTPGTPGVTLEPSRARLLLTAPKQSPPA